jgi:inosine-uridine nucleoside N-ribohydrolase
MTDPNFPKLSEAKMRQMLAPPSGRLRLVIDTDAHNEIDDQFAIAWALLSQDVFDIEGVYAAPYSFHHHRAPLLKAYEQLNSGQEADQQEVEVIVSYHQWAKNLRDAQTDPYTIPFPLADEGMELSYEEILRVYDKLDEDPEGKVFRGSPGYLSAPNQPLHSEAVDHLIARALADDERPLYVAAIGAVTNIASAILLEPKIIERIVVLWTSAYPSHSRQSNRPSLNLVQDLAASRVIFDCGVPHVYLPGFHVGAQLLISLPEMEKWVQGQGKIGDYLHHLYLNNPIHHQRGIQDHFGRTWVIWDVINFAWLLNPEWVPSQLVQSPILDDDLYWQHDPQRHLMREAYGINRDAIFRDFFQKLKKAPR